MFTIPSLANLIANHPTGTQESVAALIGGTVEANLSNPAYTSYKNTCAIRISRALNYAGDPIPASAGGITNPYMADHKIRYDMGSDKKRYIYSTYDIRAYLSGRYGSPRSFPGSASMADLAGVKGIIEFAFYHIDLWNGTTCNYHNGGFGASEVTGHEILVWETS